MRTRRQAVATRRARRRHHGPPARGATAPRRSALHAGVPVVPRVPVVPVVLVVPVVVVVLLVGAIAGVATAGVAVAQSPTTTTPARDATPAGERLPDPQPSTADSKSEASSILGGAEYQEPPKSFWETVAEWFQEQIGKVFSQGGSIWSGFAYIILAVLVGAVAFLLVRLRGTARYRSDDAGFEFDLEDRRPPREWVADAERFEARAEWKQALRCRFRALVGELIELGALRDLPGRTTGEYRVEMRAFAPDASGAFVAATDLFERAWYGDEPTGADENARFRELASQSTTGARAARRSRDDAVSVPA